MLIFRCAVLLFTIAKAKRANRASGINIVEEGRDFEETACGLK